eukprot:TRINITY_DN1334_c6_g1_i1.p1 TRINITY_DN1334_c6_g1~~TRINITY_DN1334_c6_g1_i1.p1  ORF type:complete len:189 (+),score=23.84 TRINITY_DN1334_c6_g1_i1:76-642(+)
MKLLCLGDSLTAGWYKQGQAYAPYASKVKEAIKDIDITLMGYPGADATMLRRTLESSAEYRRCEVAVVLVGTNDVIRQCRDGSKDSAMRVFSNIHDLYRILLERNIRVIPVTIPPIVPLDPEDGMTIARDLINDTIRTYAKERDLRLVEFHDTILKADSKTHFDDECHMTPLGYDLLGKLVIEQLSKM